MFGMSPVVQTIFDMEDFELPSAQVSSPGWLEYAIDENEVDMIYGIRCMPFYEYLCFKIKYKYSNSPEAEIIHKPTLMLLKKLYDIGNEEINKGIEFYCKYSKFCAYQFGNKDKFPENAEANKWFWYVILDKNTNV